MNTNCYVIDYQHLILFSSLSFTCIIILNYTKNNHLDNQSLEN